MADELSADLTADQHYALAMDFREGSRESTDLDTGDRLLALAQFHATMAVVARRADSPQPIDAPAPMSPAELRYELERIADRLRGPLPKDDPDGLITRVKELVKFATSYLVDDPLAGYLAVALYNNGLLRKNDD